MAHSGKRGEARFRRSNRSRIKDAPANRIQNPGTVRPTVGAIAGTKKNMNPYQYECTCALCGGKGVAHVRDAGADWLGGRFVHGNPEVCLNRIDKAKVEAGGGHKKEYE